MCPCQCTAIALGSQGQCELLQIAQRELHFLDTLGRGASSVVYLLVAARLLETAFAAVILPQLVLIK